MRHDNLRQYVSLRDAILQEKTQIEQRLREINQALGEMGGPSSPRLSGRVGPRAGGRSRNSMSLRDAVIEVVKTGPLPKDQILSGVQRLGYKFSTSDPMNSLGVILYGKNPKFQNEGGRFGLPSGYTPSEPKQRGRPAGSVKMSDGAPAGRRQMSPEAKEKIAAAARARWAKWRAGKK